MDAPTTPPKQKHTLRTVLLVVGLSVLLLVVLGAALGGKGGTTSTGSGGGGILDPNVADTLVISYPSCWSGSISDAAGSRSVENCNTPRFANSTWAVSGSYVGAVIQKKSDSSSELCVTILKANLVVKRQCTTAAYGVVSVNAS